MRVLNFSEMEVVVGGGSSTVNVTVVKEKIPVQGGGELTVETSPIGVDPIDFSGYDIVSSFTSSYDFGVKADVDHLTATLNASFSDGTWTGTGSLKYDTNGTFSGTGTLMHVDTSGNIFEMSASSDGSIEVKYKIK